MPSRRWRQTHPSASNTGHVNPKKNITYFRISLNQRDPKVSNTFFRIYRAGFRSSSVGLAWLAGLRRSLARLRRGFDAASTRLRRGLDAASTRPRRHRGASMEPQRGLNALCLLLRRGKSFLRNLDLANHPAAGCFRKRDYYFSRKKWAG